MKTTCPLFLALAIIVIVACQDTFGQAESVAASIAKAGGADGLGLLSEIDFTYNAKGPGVKVSRTWQWFTKTDEVFFSGKDAAGKQTDVEYARNKVQRLPPDTNLHAIDGYFVNDRFWLLFPLLLAKDTARTITMNNSAIMPISGKWAASGLIVAYASPDQNRPGDKFDLFVDSLNVIKEWVIYPSGSNQFISPYKWDNYRQFGPLSISLDRTSKGNKGMHVWFTDVVVKRNK